MRAPLGGMLCLGGLDPAAAANDLWRRAGRVGAVWRAGGYLGRGGRSGRVGSAGWRGEGQAEGEGGAAAGGVLHPDAPTMGRDETGADGEAVAGAAAGR